MNRFLFTHYFSTQKDINAYYKIVEKKINDPLNIIRYLISCELINYYPSNYEIMKSNLYKLIERNKNGLFFKYKFNFNLHMSGDIMRSPWVSCMAQSEGLIYFILLYIKKKDNEYLEIINDIIKSYLYIKDVCNENENYDDMWFVVKDKNGNIWLEEYPLFINNNFIHALNGYIFGLQGIFAYLYLFPENKKINNLLEELLNTLKKNLSKFIPNEGPTYYSLYHKIQSERYHKIHIRQLKMLYEITNDIVFKEYSNKFTKKLFAEDTEAKNLLLLENNRLFNIRLYLYKNLTFNNSTKKIVFIYGDSHSKCFFKYLHEPKSYCMNTDFLKINNVEINNYFMSSTSISGLIKENSKSNYKNIIIKNIESNSKNDTVHLFKFGQVDIFYIYYYKTYIEKKKLVKLIYYENLIKQYLIFLNKIKNCYSLNVLVAGCNLVSNHGNRFKKDIENHLNKDLNETIKIDDSITVESINQDILIFNSLLKKECIKYNISYFDTNQECKMKNNNLLEPAFEGLDHHYKGAEFRSAFMICLKTDVNHGFKTYKIFLQKLLDNV